ncbi:MAG: hypothetical protein Faunusvirus61_5, partial [Faunusvirus sp.]
MSVSQITNKMDKMSLESTPPRAPRIIKCP